MSKDKDLDVSSPLGEDFAVRSKDDFYAALADLLSHINKLSRDAGVHGYVGAISAKGRKYYRIEVLCTTSDKVIARDEDLEERGRVWGFVEASTGDVLLPASRHAPAKHARGNVFDKDSWSRFEWTGPQYLL